MTENSVSLHRVFKASPEKVYRAFTDPLAIASWIPPYGFLCEVHEMKRSRRRVLPHVFSKLFDREQSLIRRNIRGAETE